MQKVYAHEEVYDRFVEKFIVATKLSKLGDPLDPETDVSALISPNDVKDPQLD
ncbi:aldehyde dehydrogenase family protein [Peribacillus simplex]|uniref:aldehyde dehydrogenase family protein n=1 Tax=Peribacillus TaxID=2675229 RepID=UPI0036DB552A